MSRSTKRPPTPRPPLTLKQSRFVAEYLKDLNATQAAIRAGYSHKTAASQGERLLRHAAIAARVAAKTTQQLAKIEITADRVLEEIARLAFVDPRAFFDAEGTLKPISHVDVASAAAIAEFVVLKENLVAGDGKRDTVFKVKWADKLRALELLAKRFGLVKEQVEVTGVTDLVARLTRARTRVPS